jgi:D-inositol-3-phosphate glycosyltransferase
MKTLPKVLHLVDDTTAGGVMRVLDFLRSDHNLAETALHQVKSVNRGKIINNLGKADVIVSHLAISWRSLPSLIALRALYVRTSLVHVEHSYTERFMAHNAPSAHRFKSLLKLACAHRQIVNDPVMCGSECVSGLTCANGACPYLWCDRAFG